MEAIPAQSDRLRCRKFLVSSEDKKTLRSQDEPSYERMSGKTMWMNLLEDCAGAD